MPAPVVDPCRRQLERHLASSEFANGADAGLWRVVALVWPYLTVAISAEDGHELGLRLQVDGYPGTAPAGRPWDLEHDVPLPPTRWPRDGLADRTFRTDWSIANGDAPYVACDRVALQGHDSWPREHPDRAWNPSRTIVFYLAEISYRLRGATVPQQ